MWNNSCNTTYAAQEYCKYFTDSIEIIKEKGQTPPRAVVLLLPMIITEILYKYLLLYQQMHIHIQYKIILQMLLHVLVLLHHLQGAYTWCPRRNVPDFRRVFLMLKYTDITQNTYVQS